MRKVVVFECNEVPWRIVDWWCAAHPASNFAAVLSQSRQWTSVAPDEGHLSPWITWPTVHRGVANTVHGIENFGQDTAEADTVAPPWWRLATDAGVSVGLFGVLHTAPLPADADRTAFWVPDTFATDARTHPDRIEPFQAFNLAMARASARNVSTAVDMTSARRFLAAAPRLGLRPGTVIALARQLVAERRIPERRVRRRTFQSVVGFDLFDRLLATAKPDVAAFFTNHVASAMHRYWAATFPADYDPAEFGFDDEWIARWSDEIDAAMGAADVMLGRLVDRADKDGRIVVVASSMGQQAAQGTPVHEQLFLREPTRFFAAGDIDVVERRPAMDPDVNVVVAPGDVGRVRSWLDRVQVGGRPVEAIVGDDGFVSVTFGQADDAIGTVRVDGEVRRPDELGLAVEEIEDEVASTGYHVPEGILFSYDPRHAVTPTGERPTVSTTQFAPALLALLGVEPAPHLERPTIGFA